MELRHDERYGPYLTGNSSPTPFVASASQNSWGAFRAFSESLDDDITFTGLAAGAEQWVQIQLDAPIRIWAFSIACRTTVSAKDSGQVPKNFVVQGSADGISFTDIQAYTDTEWNCFASWDSESNKYNWGDSQKIEISCLGEYQYYRFLFGECQGISTQKLGSMTPTAANTVKPTLISLYQVEGKPGPQPDELDLYLNTVEGMEIIVNNTKHDDDVVTVAGADWFQFNGLDAGNLYVSGNHFVGIGANSEQLKVCRRDGAMWYLYRQEGKLFDHYRFVKLRWEGYTQYNQTSAAYALKFELFLFDNGYLFLNVIQVPTSSSYMGTSALLCNGQTTALTIQTGTPTMISFYPLDKQGLAWDIKYEKLDIQIPYTLRYLIQDNAGVLYTIKSGKLTALEAAELTGQFILDNGFVEKPDWTLLQGIINPSVLCWHDKDVKPVVAANIQAVPFDQFVISEEYDMSHPTIAGIESVTVDADDVTQFSVSFDGEKTWRAWNGSEWVVVDAGGGMTKAVLEVVTMEQWALVQTSLKYKIRAVLTENSAVKNVIVNYANREAAE